MAVVQAALANDLAELVQRAQARFEALSPSQKLRYRYMQRRSFARSFGGREMSHEVVLSDDQIQAELAT